MFNPVKLFFSIFLSFFPGIVSLFWTVGAGADSWYNTVHKTVLAPPHWVFLVVWPILYLLLAISFYLLILPRYTKRSIDLPVALFGIHMVLNTLWNYLIFGLHLIFPGVIVLIGLIITAFIMQRKFALENETSGLLIWPYIIWLIYAFYRNVSILILN